MSDSLSGADAIPPELAKLPTLSVLYLQGNQLSGENDGRDALSCVSGIFISSAHKPCDTFSTQGGQTHPRTTFVGAPLPGDHRTVSFISYENWSWAEG